MLIIKIHCVFSLKIINSHQPELTKMIFSQLWQTSHDIVVISCLEMILKNVLILWTNVSAVLPELYDDDEGIDFTFNIFDTTHDVFHGHSCVSFHCSHHVSPNCNWGISIQLSSSFDLLLTSQCGGELLSARSSCSLIACITQKHLLSLISHKSEAACK